MNPTFETSDLNKLCEFIKPLLEAGYDVRIVPDCEQVYMVDYVHREFSGECFLCYDEVNSTLEGDSIEFIIEEDEVYD